MGGRMSTLVSDSGQQVPELAMRPSLFIDRMTVIYGPSKTGKTVLVKSIMKQLHGHIDQILVVAPTEPSNRTYEGFVSKPLVHYQMHLPPPPPKAGEKKQADSEQKAALRFLERVYKRQEMMAAIYTRANGLRTLHRLYQRLSHSERKESGGHIRRLERKRKRAVGVVERRYAAEPGHRDTKVKEVNDMFRKMLALLYKQALTPHAGRLWRRGDLGEEERCSLRYLHFNPRLLLVFDDYAAQLKPFWRKEVFRKLFYQNRHSFISVIMCCQDDTDLPPNLRKNAFVSIFTDKVVCVSNFERAANKYTKTTRQFVAEILETVFQGHRKLAYIREDGRRQYFYHLTASYPRPFLFGSDALVELCSMVATTGTTMDKSNPYYDRFQTS